MVVDSCIGRDCISRSEVYFTSNLLHLQPPLSMGSTLIHVTSWSRTWLPIPVLDVIPSSLSSPRRGCVVAVGSSPSRRRRPHRHPSSWSPPHRCRRAPPGRGRVVVVVIVIPSSSLLSPRRGCLAAVAVASSPLRRHRPHRQPLSRGRPGRGRGCIPVLDAPSSR